LVQDILQSNADFRPGKIALICEDRRLTYEELNIMSNRMANALISQGVQRGDRIILYMYNCVELVVSIFAALKADGIFTVVDYATRPDKLSYIAADCGGVALVTHDHQAELTTKLMKEVPSLRFAILTGSETVWKAGENSRLLSFDRIQKELPTNLPNHKTLDCDLAYLLYTSGSTGDPKGVMTTHRSSLFAIEIAIEYLGLSENDIVTSPLPLSYSHGFNQLLKTLRVGATLILEKSFAYPARTLKRMEIERATRFAGVPTMYAILLKLDLGHYDLSRLRHLSSAGAPLAPALIEQLRVKLPQAALYSIYGMAEASNALALNPDQINQRPASVGKAFPSTEVWLVEEDGNRLSTKQVGELVVRGGHVRCGYWNDPKTSAVRFRPGLLPGEMVCYSGDMFQMDDEGYLYFMGRSDEIIKSGGKKIAPKEIENILFKLDGILDAAVVGIPDPLLGQVTKACIVLDPRQERALTIQDILEHCRSVLEDYMVPRQIEIWTSLPKTPSGKIIKSAL
jgi:acyl-coenzyme A synthetase/AMP-(fatty) acid ligase